MLEVAEDGNEKRQAKRLKAVVAEDRSKETLPVNIKESVEPSSVVQTDCWKGYSSLVDAGFIHNTVNHKEAFVARGKQNQKISTNAIECPWSYQTHRKADEPAVWTTI